MIVDGMTDEEVLQILTSDFYAVRKSVFKRIDKMMEKAIKKRIWKGCAHIDDMVVGKSGTEWRCFGVLSGENKIKKNVGFFAYTPVFNGVKTYFLLRNVRDGEKPYFVQFPAHVISRFEDRSVYGKGFTYITEGSGEVKDFTRGMNCMLIALSHRYDFDAIVDMKEERIKSRTEFKREKDKRDIECYIRFNDGIFCAKRKKNGNYIIKTFIDRASMKSAKKKHIYGTLRWIAEQKEELFSDLKNMTEDKLDTIMDEWSLRLDAIEEQVGFALIEQF